MNIVLTGATGALGKKFMSLYPETVPVRVRRGEYDQLLFALGSADVLVHAGALVPGSSITDEQFNENAFVAREILHLIGDFPVILISSMSILGVNGLIKKSKLMTTYARSKFYMELEARGIPGATVVRFSTLFYGDPARDGLSKLIYTAKTEGRVSVIDCRRDFLPLTDACRGLRNVCDKTGGVVNLVTGQVTNLQDVALHLQDKYGTKVDFKEDSDGDVCSSFPAARVLNVDLYKEIDDYYQSIGD